MDSLSTKTTLRKLKSALHTLPEGLEKTYDEVWQRIKGQNPDDAELASRVICWICYVGRPLTVAELQHALAVEPGDKFLDNNNITNEHLLMSGCAGLVLVQPESGIVGMVHHTAQEYFERRAAQHFPSARKEILHSCLNYLLLNEFNSGPCSTDQRTETRLEKWPFLQYAAKFWGYHARGELEESEEGFITEFLNQDSNLSSSIQMMYTKSHKFEGYTQHFPRNVTALSLAANCGLCHMVQVLLVAGADVMLADDLGMKPLHRAAISGQDEVVRLLLEHRADQFKESALRLAAQEGREAVVRVLLEYEADINATDDCGWTALHIASEIQHEGLVKLLLGKKADVSLLTAYGGSALCVAAYGGNLAIAELLLNHGASVDFNTLHVATVKRQDQVMQMLLENSIDIEWRDVQGKIAGHHLGVRGNSALVEWRDSQGRLPLHQACARGNIPLTERLLSRGFDPRALDEQNRTCLHHAASAGSSKIMSRFLEEGLDPLQLDIDQWTPLHWAARKGTEPCVKMLIDASSKQTILLSRWNPRELAQFHGHFNIAKLLSKHFPVSPETQHFWKPKEKPNSPQPINRANYVNRKKIIEAMRHRGYFCSTCDQVSLKPAKKSNNLLTLSSLFMAHATNAWSAMISIFALNVFYHPTGHIHLMNLR